ncbi:MAG: hypothetical protein JF609_02605 [Verrucomicrobia bacterium]|nr:hypothetical protein [Verrucomicrobiota bacterium]
MPVQLLGSTFRASHAGFSLIEIVLALGIISFALVGILGLFPVAVNAAADSQHETQAALIARSIFDQLEATPNTPKRTIKPAKKYDDRSVPPVVIDLSKNDSAPPMGFDADGFPLASADDPSAAYKVNIAVTPITTPDYGLSQVVVTVNLHSVSYPFTALLRQQ